MKRVSRASADCLDDCFDEWFASRGWRAFEFQRQVWHEAQQGRSGLLHASTGAGKTYAVWFAALKRAIDIAAATATPIAPLRVLWLTPMRALASDTFRALSEPLADTAIAARLRQAVGVPCQVGSRTGDTSSAERARQTKRLPFALVTTPESLSLLLTRAQSPQELGNLTMVVVDEWHELMGNKRGVQTQLAIARLRQFNPGMVVWGLSATLGTCTSNVRPGRRRAASAAVARRSAKVVDDRHALARQHRTLSRGAGIWVCVCCCRFHAKSRRVPVPWCLPTPDRRPNFGIRLCSMRNPHWAGLIALHHGSLDKKVREWVELGLKEGRLKAVVCTSSLDLGVDFSPVERVLQIGSPKGVARLLQRAGRSGHSPGRPSRVTLVPTNALELLESAAAQDAIAAKRIEARHSPQKPLDVLVQHLVTIALGTGFTPEALLAEVRSCHAYRELTDAEFQWALDFVTKGGQSLWAYPEYHRVVADGEGVYRVPDAMIAKRHRMSIGTIVADASMQVKYLTGKKLGAIEESFISRLRKGDQFLFGGRLLELVRVHEMNALVRRATSNKGAVPRWNGGKMPLSNELAQAMLDRLERASQGEFAGAEMNKLRPLLEVQARWSALPTSKLLVAESLVSRDGHHLFLYPFAGRHVHIGLGSLLAWRVRAARRRRSPSRSMITGLKYFRRSRSIGPACKPARCSRPVTC